MANFTPTPFDVNSVNGGQRYENGDKLDASSLNAIVEGAAYSQLYEHYYAGYITFNENTETFAISFNSTKDYPFNTNEELIEYIKLAIGGKRVTGFVTQNISNLVLCYVNSSNQLSLAGMSLAGTLLEITATNINISSKVVNRVM